MRTRSGRDAVTTRDRHPRPPGEADGGFTLVEVVVAFTLFMVLAGTAGVALVGVLQTSRANEARVVAANLAARDIETVRGLAAAQVPDGDTPTRTVEIDGRTYYLDRTSTLDVAGGSGSACAGASGPAAFKRVTVTVTWDRMDGVAPVRSDTLKALGVSGLTGGKGVLSVPVLDASGAGVPGLTVTLGAATARTQSDGCAVFSGVSPSTAYTVSVAAAGYVGRAGATTVSQSPVAVYSGQVTKASALVLDRSARLDLTVPAPTGYPVPSTVGLTLGNTDFTSGTAAFASCSTAGPGCATGTGGARQIGSLYPSTAGYTVWPGTCATARPVSPPVVVVSPGATTSATTTSLGGVAAVVKSGPLFRPGYTLTATNTACATETYAFTGLSGLSDADALELALPPGTWSLAAALAGLPMGTPTTVTVTAGAVVGGGTPAVVTVP